MATTPDASNGGFDRREFLRLAAGGAAAAGMMALPRSLLADPPTRPSLLPTVEIDMPMRVASIPYNAGDPTTVWRFEPTLLKGPAGSVTNLPNNYLGPIIRVKQGQRVRINVRNELPEESVVHWHGLDVPEAMDGHPRDAFLPGQSYLYEFEVQNRAGTYWFHPHPDMRTGFQVMKGLTGMFIVEDCIEDALDLPRGSYDKPLIIQDRTFNAANQFAYTPMTNSGFLGNTIFVNGQPNAAWSVANCVYRFRVLNGCNARTCKLAFSDGTPMTAIAVDGGLLPAPVTKPYIMLSPGERVDLWVDLRGKSVGSQLKLQSLAWTPGGPAGSSIYPHGAAFDVLTLNVAHAFDYPITLPTTLAPFTPYNLADAVNPTAPRVIAINFAMGMFMMNNRMFEMENVATDEIFRLGDLYLLEFTNFTGNPQMPHPMHLHGPQFQIISRSVNAAGLNNYNTVRDGLIDGGWKDTFLLMPGETVRVLVKRDKHPGLFVYHCHILEHEDMAMMRNFRVDP
ncbi:MAG: multicopper oxidase family protein [Phycisphaerales bacterium]